VIVTTVVTAIRYRNDMSIFDHHSDGLIYDTVNEPNKVSATPLGSKAAGFTVAQVWHTFVDLFIHIIIFHWLILRFVGCCVCLEFRGKRQVVQNHEKSMQIKKMSLKPAETSPFPTQTLTHLPCFSHPYG